MSIHEHADLFNVTESLGAFRVHSMGTSAKNQREAKGMFDRLWLPAFAFRFNKDNMGWKMLMKGKNMIYVKIWLIIMM